MVADFARSGVIDPLNSYAGNAASTLYKGVQDDLKLCDGKTWSWPISKSVYVQFYNKDMLAAAGQQVPKSWEEFASVAKAVSRNGVTAISIDPGGVGDCSTSSRSPGTATSSRQRAGGSLSARPTCPPVPPTRRTR